MNLDDIKEINRRTIEEFRANGGAGPFADRPLLLLTTTGRRSGRAHTAPMMYLRDGDRLLVFASVMGAPRHPDWYHNLIADPSVTVEVGSDKYRARAVPTEGEERDRLFAAAVERHSFFAEHQAGTDRVIPVVALSRAEPADG
ncbi:nitroreductase family deazaflavin-dependent oxidoreductase [Spongiactinospora sp. TRM90649]|uniref:nitroreductase family deazaflavin-dependent oxidoreductase n=1 Tax=Spongiactinospora sp. TRM90649 TaxID=3031114 RepID=UPI0023F8E86A|nr:nitroreductase family deazaflavin-dependent oxidoreductase [Spongiactinospora sp. TRM90649]MDF5755735.1 nitroreductase family deazaflavin-dependent oxidoreductase [Spongiactinospora sp. TRM90649]